MNKTALASAFLVGGISGAVITLLSLRTIRRSHEMLQENIEVKETALDAIKKVRISSESAIKDLQKQIDLLTKETETLVQRLKDTRQGAGKAAKKTRKKAD